jgi:hypothetical protein
MAAAAKSFRSVGFWAFCGVLLLLGLLLFPVFQILSGVPHGKARAANDCVTIVAAIKAYYTEYGHWPVRARGPSTGDIPSELLFGGNSARSNAEVFDILRNIAPKGVNHPDNPRRIIFFDTKTALDPAAPRGGFVPVGATKGTPGAYMDPWGHEYAIVMAAEGEEQIIRLPYPDFQGRTHGPHVRVAVFSLGKDGIVGSSSTQGRYQLGTTQSDDIISWQ